MPVFVAGRRETAAGGNGGQLNDHEDGLTTDRVRAGVRVLHQPDSRAKPRARATHARVSGAHEKRGE